MGLVIKLQTFAFSSIGPELTAAEIEEATISAPSSDATSTLASKSVTAPNTYSNKEEDLVQDS